MAGKRLPPNLILLLQVLHLVNGDILPLFFCQFVNKIKTDFFFLAGRIDVSSPGLTTDTKLPIETQVNLKMFRFAHFAVLMSVM